MEPIVDNENNVQIDPSRGKIDLQTLDQEERSLK